MKYLEDFIVIVWSFQINFMELLILFYLKLIKKKNYEYINVQC